MRPISLMIIYLLIFGTMAIAQPLVSHLSASSSLTKKDDDPEAIMKKLVRNPYMNGADQMIRSVAKKDPDIVYTYAAPGSPLRQKIKSSTDPLVKTIGRMAGMKTGRMYFPFLDELYKGNQSFENIEPVLKNDTKYYQLLVTTQVAYAERLSKGEVPIGYRDLEKKLKQKAVEVYVNEINGLHNSPDVIRFKKIQSLSPEELYYLVVMGADEIYTSSYLGVYKRIFEKLGKEHAGDTLLARVNNDHFKKWVKLAAAYNTLNDFLSKMDKDNATALMKNFVKGLNQSKLEDAVDVADAYASISDPVLLDLILSEVQQNKIAAGEPGSKNIYDLLNTIFLSKDTANGIDITTALGINPVFNMPNSYLKDSSNEVIIQQFIYGDEIGPADFAAFLATFRNSNWKIIDKKEWVEIVSQKSDKVSIFANKPLDEKKGLDARAQEHLNDYLYKNKLYPTVAIHRGHSYHVRSTIEQLPSSAKVVILGSCGGYNNLSDVLKACPQAHIIATKQTGTALVTQPLINMIADKLRGGKDLNWPQIWSDLDAKFNDKISRDRFEDYIPPHKNLGAIFMIAYNKVNG